MLSKSLFRCLFWRLMLDLIFCVWFSNKCFYRSIKQILFLGIHPYPLPLRISLYRQKQLLPPHLFSGRSMPFLFFFVMLTVAGNLQVFKALATETRIVSLADWLRLRIPVSMEESSFETGTFFGVVEKFIPFLRAIISTGVKSRLDSPFLLVNHGRSWRLFAY